MTSGISEKTLRLPRPDIAEAGERTVIAEFTVSPSLVWLRGHFPDAPVLPGAAELFIAGSLAGEISALRGAPLSFSGADRVKFMRPALPGDRLRAELTLSDSGDSVSFRLVPAEGGPAYSSGTLLLRGAEGASLSDAPCPEAPARLVLDHEDLAAVMPQKGPMLMADALLSFSLDEAAGTVSGMTVSDPYASGCAAVSGGEFPPLIITESMAQCVCAVMAERQRREGRALPIALLLGVRGLFLDAAVIAEGKPLAVWRRAHSSMTRGVSSPAGPSPADAPPRRAASPSAGLTGRGSSGSPERSAEPKQSPGAGSFTAPAAGLLLTLPAIV